MQVARRIICQVRSRMATPGAWAAALLALLMVVLLAWLALRPHQSPANTLMSGSVTRGSSRANLRIQLVMARAALLGILGSALTLAGNGCRGRLASA